MWAVEPSFSKTSTSSWILSDGGAISSRMTRPEADGQGRRSQLVEFVGQRKPAGSLPSGTDSHHDGAFGCYPSGRLTKLLGGHESPAKTQETFPGFQAQDRIRSAGAQLPHWQGGRDVEQKGVFEDLGPDECLALMSTQRLGRLGVVVDGVPLVLPMGFV